MKIDRSELISELEAFARGGNGVVVGPPGVGKSYALSELRQRFKAAAIPHLVLPVERLGAASDVEIAALLQKEGDFVELLRAAVGESKSRAVLIFDGYDAARGENERVGIFRMILRAVNGLRGLWNVVVSVRSFDAKKSQRLLALFPDSRDGLTCRQFSIPALTAQELDQAFQQISGLQELHTQGTHDFRGLLTIPFNLWLIERVLKAGAKLREFSQVTSEVQLLEMYWDYRVRAATNAEDRGFLLKTATEAMVGTRKLSVRRDKIYSPETKEAWEGLLSDEILTEIAGREPSIGFAHNILFDFAVSVYLLDSDPTRFAAFVAEQPGRPLFLRPSLVYHFTRLWHFNRPEFWINFWSVIQQETLHLRQIVRLVLPTVIVNESLGFDDVSPLLKRLENKQQGGNEAVAFLLQAIRILNSPKRELWAAFIQSIGLHLDHRFAWDAGVIGNWIADSPERLAATALANCGDLGRKLMHWAWGARSDPNKKQWFERLVAFVAVPLIAKTYNTAPDESRTQLAPILEVFGEPEFPIDCIYRLTNEIERILRVDAPFAATIYERVFGYQEKSDKITSMGGHVMTLLSNRRQDYGMCRYVLMREYPKFLATAPLQAIKAGIRAIQAFEIEAHVLRHGRKERGIDQLTSHFAFRGLSASYVEDGSAIWDTTSYPDQEMQIPGAIFEWIGKAAEQHRSAELNKVLDLFAAEAILAFMWSRLLGLGAAYPQPLGSLMWEIAKAPSVLQQNDALYSLGAYLEAVLSILSPDQVQEIELAILRLGQGESGENNEFWLNRRKRLIARFAPHILTTKEGKELRTLLEEKADLPANRPLFTFSSSVEAYTEDKFLRDQGAKLELPENQALRELYKPLVEWRDKNRREAEIDVVLPNAWTLRDVLMKGNCGDDAVSRAAWTHLAGFASDALRQTQTANTERFQKLRAIVLESAKHKDPEPNPQYDSTWDSASWSPAPRNESAQALPWLTHFGEDSEALNAIKELLIDPVPSVRFLLACELWRLVEHNAGAMWTLFDGLVAQEQNEVVLQGITVSLWRLISLSRPGALLLIQKLLARVGAESDDDEKPRSQLICMVVDFAVWEDNQWAKDTLEAWRKEPLKFSASVMQTGHRLIEYVTPSNSGDRLKRARDLLLLELDAIAQALKNLQNNRPNVITVDFEKKWKTLYSVIDQAVMRIYFAAEVNRNLGEGKESPLTDEARWSFFQDAWPVLEKVLSFGKGSEAGVLLAPTAHHFIELLNGVLRYDPSCVLGIAAEVVTFSRRFNYNLDSLAMDEIVKLVSAILVDYREAVQDDTSVKYLLTILDAFVEAGWPQALNLVWRLDELYR
jgi:hypothetical protein